MDRQRRMEGENTLGTVGQAQWRSQVTKGPGAKNELGPQLNCLSFINTSENINSYI